MEGRMNPEGFDMLKVSIIIATHNEESMIGGKLKNTLELDCPKGVEIGVVVVDGGSTDETVKIVKSFRGVKLICEAKRGGKARGLIKAFGQLDADASLVVISDADCRLEKGVIKKAIKYFERGEVGAITGRQILVNPTSSRDARAEGAYKGVYTKMRVLESKIDSTPIMHGEFLVVRREVMESPSPDSVADDTEMALKIRRKGYKTLYAPDCVFYEASPTTLKGRVAQKERRGQGLIQVFWRNKDMFLNPKYGKFGMVVFPFEFSLYILSPFLFFGGMAVLTLSTIFFKSIWLALSLLALLIATKISTTTYSFVTSEWALLKGAVKLMLSGPSHSWTQIEETREVLRGWDKN